MSGFDKIAELYEKKESIQGLLFEMVEEILTAQSQNQKIIHEVGQGAKARERILRLPHVIPTEVSVGQKPGSQDRKQFELWMKNIGMGPGSDVNAVAAKLKAITSFFDEPEGNLAEATIAETLSYLMFLNQFVWMIKEFNASVAGFLWEPFLASLFGGKSTQIHTGEGNIADIHIFPKGSKKGEYISLKILSETGEVKGSFRDLVNHFAEGGDSMRYVVVVKEQSEVEREVSAVTFYEFDIKAANFFDWIGTAEYEEVPRLETKVFTINNPPTRPPYGPVHIKWGASKLKAGKPDAPGEFVWIRHSKPSRKKQVEEWLKLGQRRKNGLVQINDAVAKKINLQGHHLSNGLAAMIDPDKTKLSADLATYAGGGIGGARPKKTYQPTAEAIFGPKAKKLWGAQGSAEWARLRDEGWTPERLFTAIRDGVTLEDGRKIPAAPGITGKLGATQFKISASHYKGMAGNIGGAAGRLGTLKITTKKVEDFFIKAAENLNEELVIMFNSLADLTDNIGRFFLVDCGDGTKCTEKDAANRNAAGARAIQDAHVLEDAVVASVRKVTKR